MVHRREEPVFIEWNGPNNGLGDVQGEVQIPDWMTRMGTTDQIRAACTDPVRTIITAEGWKLNCSPLSEHELYNLRKDPLEARNVIEQNRTRACVLRDEILRWQEETGDAVTLPEL